MQKLGRESVVLREGTDYYIGADGRAYFYNNVRTILEAQGAEVSFVPGEKKGESAINVTAVVGGSVLTLKEGVDYYIGMDGKAHYLGGPEPPGGEKPGAAPAQPSTQPAPQETPSQSSETSQFIWPLTLNERDIAVSCEYLDTVYHPKVHRGMDIKAPRWTEIHAIADGTVLFVVSDKVEGIDKTGRGNYVIINHGNGYRAIYQHNIANNVMPGDKVFKNDVIAFVGNTGRSSGPHLHLEIMEGVPESAKANFEDYADDFKDTKHHKKDPREYLPPTNY
jgi:murein DD-endopeptidase MepM/ murein hydrolase activator NlpD